jgi:predicted amidohydrolase
MSTLTITGIQTALHWEDAAANRKMFKEKINSIAGKTEIIIIPETFSTGFSMKPKELAETMEGETVNWMKKIAADKKVILTGSIIIKENENYFNRLIWILPNGQTGIYDKRHLFGYAGEDNEFTPGTKRLIASVKGWKINLLVCYDLRFPVWARQQVQEDAPEYDLLIYVANWPERRNHAWKTLLQARAIENQSYVAAVNRVGDDGNNIYHSGNSVVIDFKGEVLTTAIHDETVLYQTLEREPMMEFRKHFPFLAGRDEFEIKL